MKTHTRDAVSESASDVRENLSAALENGKELCNTVRDQVVAGAKTADHAVRNHTYEAIGLTFVLGTLMGFLLGRRK